MLLERDREAPRDPLTEGRAVSCALCGEARATELFAAPERRYGMPGSFEVVRCDSCGLVRTEPQPEDLGAYYPSGYYSFSPPSPPSRLERAYIRRRYGLPANGGALAQVESRIARSRLTQGLPPGPPGRILDVGCGSGETLLALAEAGWECQGVELSEQAVAAARAAGLSVHHGGLPTDFPDASFDVVRFWHSLEHMPSPRLALEEARRLLEPGGHLVVGVPNFGSLLRRVFRHDKFYLDFQRHLWHLASEDLVSRAEACNFETPSGPTH